MARRFAVLTCLSTVLFLGLSVSAAAGSINLTLTGASGPADNGVIVGPYDAIMNGNAVQIICDDYDDHVHLGENWTAHASSLADLSAARFELGQSTQLHDYEAVLWLTQLMMGSDQSVWCSIHFALWAIFSTMAHNSAGFQGDALAQSLYTRAMFTNTYQPAQFNGWYLLTPDRANPDGTWPQEYVIQLPEASSLLLLVLALAAVVLATRKFKLAVALR